ncbi:distal membrane arm assembly component 2 [Anticarsia gemmatalis]|uniref:distal membrane arm assembly component 2 n=1 Tax=Anticarsia gemmatalis TaxID=129554 RepID=UPI003F75F3ED
MALSLKPNRHYRPLYTIARTYCDKSIYQREEEGEKPRTVHGQAYADWRKPWIKRDGEWKSKLSVFVEKNPSPDVLAAMSRIPNLNMKMVKDWWANMKQLQEIENQKFLKERVATLGSNLGAVHFFTFRQAAVRLKGSPRWIKGDITTLKLPDSYEDGWLVEAVDCTDFHHNGIRYEGLQNLANLNFLKWLCIRNSKHVDVWCIDRIAGQNGQSLEYLDMSGCKLCVGSIMALARMPALKYLVLTDPGDNMTLQAALSMLEEEKPDLLIKAIDPVS